MDELNESAKPAARGGGAYYWHAVAGAWILLVLVTSFVRHRDVEALWSAATEGTTGERALAAQALAMRAEPEALTRVFPEAFLASDAQVLRELAFSNLFTRLPGVRLDARALSRLPDAGERARAGVLLRCRTTTNGRVQRADLDQWFAAPPPAEGEGE